jgi:hypothetical protein
LALVTFKELLRARFGGWNSGANASQTMIAPHFVPNRVNIGIFDILWGISCNWIFGHCLDRQCDREKLPDKAGCRFNRYLLAD